MKNKLALILLTGMLAIASTAHASESTITNIWFSGPDDPHHPDVVQFQLANGFPINFFPECNPDLAAIRNNENTQHMISFALLAFNMGIPITVQMNVTDTYFGDRCTISRISAAK